MEMQAGIADAKPDGDVTIGKAVIAAAFHQKPWSSRGIAVLYSSYRINADLCRFMLIYADLCRLMLIYADLLSSEKPKYSTIICFRLKQ